MSSQDPSEKRFALLAVDRRSALWIALSDHMIDRLNVLRQQNDSHLPIEQTERLRGRIAQLKELLALGEIRSPGSS